MATTVCVEGCAFDVDGDGKLVLKINGSPANLAWPDRYGGGPADCNPLRCDPAGGLWVPPPADSDIVDPDVVATEAPAGAGANILTLSFPLENPSGCLSANAFIAYEIDYSYAIGTSDSMTLGVEFDKGDGAGYGGVNNFTELTGLGLGSGVTGRVTTTLVRTIENIDAGETRTVKLRLSGTGTFTLDPASITARSIIVTEA